MSISPDRPSFPLRTAENYAPEQIKSEAFDHLVVAVAQLTVDGTLLTVNSRLCEVLGRSKDDLLEKNLREVFRCEEPWSECASGLSRLIAG